MVYGEERELNPTDYGLAPKDRKVNLNVSYHSLSLLKAEKLRRLKYELYRRKPLVWLKEVMREDPRGLEWTAWGEAYEKHTWDGDVNPLQKAWEDVSNNLWVGLKAATGTGKTFFLSRLCLWFLDCWEDSLVITSAPKESQLIQNMWGEMGKVIDKFKVVRPYSRLTKLSLKPEGNNPLDVVTTQNTHQAIGFVIGVGSEEESATKAQGYHREHMLIICEETPGMKASVMTAFQNTCTGTHNIMVAVGNPDGEMDELNKFCELPNVKDYRISAYDYPNVVLNADVIKGAVTVDSIERRRLKYGEDSPLFQSRVRGITPSEGDNNVIRKAWLDAIMPGNSRYQEGIVRILDESEAFNAIGVDVSNSEVGDKAAVAYGKGNVLHQLKDFQCPNANSIAHNLMLSEEKLAEMAASGPGMDKVYRSYGLLTLEETNVMYPFVGVDAVGVGVATINTFLEYGLTVQSLSGGQWEEAIPYEEFRDADNEVKYKYLYQFANLRSQMIWELREDIRNMLILIDLNDAELRAQLVKELTAARFMLHAGRIAIEGKDKIKLRLGHSPNLADAVAYWNWARKGYRANVGTAFGISGGK